MFFKFILSCFVLQTIVQAAYTGLVIQKSPAKILQNDTVRIEFTKTLKQKTEEARIKIRRVREDVWNKIQSMEKSGEIREDDKFRGKDDLQKAVDGFNKKIEEVEKKKEEELMTV